ncbi:hypothetical protein SeMB42_g05789 [Synchytrium endobioticum]|uniref:Uncharacterized protein n=1 Tax=Synchytrium endobioticum TaxID=286115 RepID=A0A507CPE0_9FUNG|nr:hypothetical protein SeMB42_g05789 [Synchytrium endobioticum]TPX50929.1 hypothetical protein SeLEV6574_g00618 [Synchytrium endobioticum]
MSSKADTDTSPSAFRQEVNQSPTINRPSGQTAESIIAQEFISKNQADLYPSIVRQIENQGTEAQKQALHIVEAERGKTERGKTEITSQECGHTMHA